MTSSKTWYWQGNPISYTSCGETGPAVVLVHGFGACWQHWRKNIPVLGEHCRCYALDLIGFGASAKPTPTKEIDYTFSTWAKLIADFCNSVVGEKAFLVGNSIGCIAIMQAVVDYPDIASEVALINFSLRLLHKRKIASLPWYRRLGAPVLQKLLTNPSIGNFFFRQIAQPKTVRKILLQAYRRHEAVTDELVEILLKPASDKGAAEVFLAFTGYSDGPLPEDLFPKMPCQAIVLWGTEDPWEPIALAKDVANNTTVKKFIPLEGLGHCPQDEDPQLVNSLLLEWIRDYPEK